MKDHRCKEEVHINNETKQTNKNNHSGKHDENHSEDIKATNVDVWINMHTTKNKDEVETCFIVFVFNVIKEAIIIVEVDLVYKEIESI